MELTANHNAALALYIEKHGAGWVEKLLDDWRTGADVNALPGDYGCYLRHLRNNLGPRWLVAEYGENT